MTGATAVPPRAWVALGAATAFVALAWQQHSGGALVALDMWLAHQLHAAATPVLVGCMLWLSHWHNSVGLLLMALLLIGALLWQQRRRQALFVLLAVAGGMLLNVSLKQLFQRARPVFEEPLLTLPTYSFPSGHAAGSTVLYGALLVLTWRSSWRWPVTALAVLMISLVCLSRLGLGVHFRIDVLAGVLVGVLWITLCLSVLRQSADHDRPVA